MYQKFYKEGLVEIPFIDQNLDNILKDIYEGKIKEKYFLKEKYAKTLDLRPSIFDYDDSILFALKKNNIKNVLRSHTLRNLLLSHVQIRIVKNENSYMNWHRDTYYNQKNDLIGQAPPGVKIIYYPEFSNQPADRLHYLIGSNRIIFPSNVFDNQLFNILKKKTITSKKGSAILFDTAGLHAVVPEEKDKISLRIIYNFLEKEQIDNISKDPENIHQQTAAAYQKIW